MKYITKIILAVIIISSIVFLTGCLDSDTPTASTPTISTDAQQDQVTSLVNQQNSKLGDVNQDDTVSVEDAQLTLIEYIDFMAGMKSTLTEEQVLLADINADKVISVEDAQYILIYYVSNTLSGANATWDQIMHPEGYSPL